MSGGHQPISLVCAAAPKEMSCALHQACADTAQLSPVALGSPWQCTCCILADRTLCSAAGLSISCSNFTGTAGAASDQLMRDAGAEAPAAEQLQRVKAATHGAESGDPTAPSALAATASPRAVHEAQAASKRQPTRGQHMLAPSKLPTAAAGQPGLAKAAPSAAAVAVGPRRAKAPSRLPEGGSPASSPEPAAAAAGQQPPARAVTPAADLGAAPAGPSPGRGSVRRLPPRSLPWSCAACTLRNPGGSAAGPRCIGCRTQLLTDVTLARCMQDGLVV